MVPCYAYSVADQVKGELICEKIKEAHKVAKELEKEREGNPFHPITEFSEDVKVGHVDVQTSSNRV